MRLIDILDGLILHCEARFDKSCFDLAVVFRKQRNFNDAISTLRKAEKVDSECSYWQQRFTPLDEDKHVKTIDYKL